MKKIIMILSLILPGICQAELCLIDKIECVVCGPEKNAPFVDTDASWKRNIDGKPIPLQQQLQQEIVTQQVVADKLPLDPTAADKYVEMMKKQNNLSDSDLSDMFEQVGRTYNEGIALLNSQYIQEIFMHHKFKSQLIPTEDAILEYCQQNPEYVDGWCEVQVAYVECDKEAKGQMKQKLDQLMVGKEADDVTIEWTSAIKLNPSDLAEDKKFISEMNSGQVIVKESEGSFELYKMLDKQDSRLKSIDERRSSVVDRLNRQRFEGMLANYNEEVCKFIDVINLNENIVMQN